MRQLLLAMVTLIPVFAAAPAAAAGLSRPPAEACAYLDDQGLGTGGDYREYRPGKFYCWSLRKDIAAGDPKRHNVRYAAEGTEEAVATLTLELQLVSRSELQRAHKLLADYARALTQEALGVDLPQEVAGALLVARPGRWPVGTTSWSFGSSEPPCPGEPHRARPAGQGAGPGACR